MSVRVSYALAACVLLSAFLAPRASAQYPAHELWVGVGGAASSEKDIFNVPGDIESSPEAVFTFGYAMNLDERRAFAVHLYGAAETTPTVTLVDPSGSQDTQFDLYTYNFGVRYRHTFSRRRIAPYAFVGISYAFGSIESSVVGQLEYKGVSGCIGPGASVHLGRSLALSLEVFGSFGTSSWEQKPFTNSGSDEFDPSLLGATINLSFAWGWRQ